MGGEKTKTLADTFGVHTVSAQRCVDKFLDAADQCDHLLLTTNRLPESPDELKKAAAEWMKQSGAFNIYDGFLGAIDG